MSVFSLSGKNTIKLLRIPFSLLLMPIFLLAISQTPDLNTFTTLASFIIVHLLVYPASNGYNSYIDKDETSIGGLEKPPMPTKDLFYLTLCMDIIAIILAAVLISLLFASCIICYIVASRAYSSRQIRLKKYPLAGFLVVVIFQGGFTYYMSSAGIAGTQPQLSLSNLYLMLACSVQIAGAYPLTQIYQHNEDIKDGVITISYKLGYRGTFIFCALMFMVCNVLYWLYFQSTGQEKYFYFLQVFFIPIVVYFSWWFLQVIRNTGEANFKNTMRMNILAACCMNSFFIFLILAKYTN